MSVKIRTETTRLDALLAAVPERAALAVQQTAESAVEEMRQGWSAVSPSAPGDPPAVVSGALDASISAAPAGDTSYRITVGAAHAPLLEYGTSRMAARPFMAPALWSAAALLVERLRERLRL